MNIQPIVQSGITTQNNQYNQAEQAPPAQIPQSELPNGCEAGFVVHIPDDIQQHAPECGERTALLSLIQDEGLLSGLDKYLAPHLEEGSAGEKSVGYVWFIQCHSDGIRNTQRRSWYLW